MAMGKGNDKGGSLCDSKRTVCKVVLESEVNCVQSLF